jgi:hypothetical protein
MKRHIFCLLAVAAVGAAAEEDPIADLKKGQPKDVAALIERIVECTHWSGEEPYDRERRNEILSAQKDLKCDRVAIDETTIRQRYARNPQVLNALKQAKEMSY